LVERLGDSSGMGAVRERRSGSGRPGAPSSSAADREARELMAVATERLAGLDMAGEGRRLSP
jgi:hypothetical protein